MQDTSVLDRLFWCERCREQSQRRAARWGWVAGAVVAALLGVWVFLGVQPVLLPGGWIGVVAAAFYLAARIVREIIYGAMRIRNRRAVEAVPPGESEGTAE